MKKVIAVLVILSLLVLIIKNGLGQEDRKLKKESDAIMYKSSIKMFNVNFRYNTDSVRFIYDKLSKEDTKVGLEFAKSYEEYVSNLEQLKNKKKDSLDKILSIKNERLSKEAEKKWYNTKAGKIQKKHPTWSKYECELIAEGKIWIGMKYEMLVYLRGKPDSSNPSNYGGGVQWQWCWYDRTPSCFYGGEDRIITAYN